MTHQDRDRLAFSLVLALLIHAAIIVMLTLVDWEIREYPVTPPVLVDLLDYRSTPPAIEPVPTPAEEPIETPPPEAPEDSVVEQEPVDPEILSAPLVPSTTPDPGDSAPQDQVSETPAPQTTVRDAPPGSFSTENLPWLRSDSAAVAREDARQTEAVPLTFDEPTETGQLPAWIPEGTIQPLSSLDPTDRENLAEKESGVPGFAELMDRITRSLSSSQPAVDRSQPAIEVGEESSEASLPGDSSLDWVGGGSRSPIGPLALPEFTGQEFGGLVPARVTYIIVFDVNSDGLVIPGSLILRQSSGYTAADQKVHQAVSGWYFELAPGSQPVTAICTLILERDD